MPFVKNISLKRKKSAAAPAPMSFSITATATGSAGYFTGSNSKIYSGATTLTPIYITFTTSSVVNGTPPYICKWTASTSYWPPGYVSGTDTGSITVETYAYESERWTATITDSSNPPNVVSSSFDSIIYSADFELFVGTWDATGSDTQDLDLNNIPGGTLKPLKTIDAAIRYAVPDNTIILVASGTYNENPVLDKRVYLIDGTADVNGNPSLGSGNYFIYGTTDLTGSFSRVRNSVIKGFTSSSFDIIGVSPSGSIEMALTDSTSSKTVQLLEGVYDINQPITANKWFNTTITGVPINTISGSSYSDFTPKTILRIPNSNATMFIAYPNASGSGRMSTIRNITMEKYWEQGRLIVISASVLLGTDLYVENCRFRTISQSIAYDLYYNNVMGGGQSSLGWSTSLTPQTGSLTYQAPNRFTFDTSRTSGFGSGRIIFGPYTGVPHSHIGTSSIIGFNPWEYFNMAHHDLTIAFAVSGSTTVQRVYQAGGSGNISGVLSTHRPIIGWGDWRYNGTQYLKFDGTSDVMIKGITSIPATSSLSFFCVFGPNSLTNHPAGIIYKVGNSFNGMTLAMTGSQVALTFYQTGSDAVTTASVHMLAPVSNGTYYLAEMFFDGTSGALDKRIGMALYGTSSLITSSYFSTSSFSIPNLKFGAATALQNHCIGGGNGNWRVADHRIVSGTSIASDYYNGTWAMTYIDVYANVAAGYYSHSNRARKAVYDILRLTYFPSSSFVTHSLFANS